MEVGVKRLIVGDEQGLLSRGHTIVESEDLYYEAEREFLRL